MVYPHNSVNVVWHDDKFIRVKGDFLAEFCSSKPFTFRDSAETGFMKDLTLDVSKYRFSMPRGNGDKITACQGGIMKWQAN